MIMVFHTFSLSEKEKHLFLLLAVVWLLIYR